MTACRPALAGLLLLAACSRGDLATAPAVPIPPALTVTLATSRLRTDVGDTISLTLGLRPSGGQPVSGFQGSLHFDPERLRFLGQPLAGHALVMLNARRAAAGRLRLLALDVTGLDSVPVDLRFVVRSRKDAGRIGFDFEEAVLDRAVVLHRADVIELAEARPSPLAEWPARAVAAEDWIRYFGEEPASQPALLLPGQGRLYGDANLSQTVSVADVVSVSNVAVGNLPLLTDANRDYAIAANVAPQNLPGLGEPDDSLPPGRNSDGSYTISVADATAIANESVGNDLPVPGSLIPGRGPAATARVVISDSIRTNRTFFRDTVYELQGTIIVGSPNVADVTLTIEAGTRIEGDVLTRGRLVIRRGANLVAIGTRLQPIIFTCNAPQPFPGCWGGVTFNGFGVLNNGDPLPDGEVGFPTKQGVGGSGTYGGILVEDSSGVLRHVRIEFAGAVPFNAPDTLPALQLLGVGSKTQLDNIQLYQPLGDGVFVSGGTARLRDVMVTVPGGVALRWRDGWQGRGQFLALQLGSGSRGAILGQNFVADPTVLPRSEPVLSHLTITGPAPSGITGPAIQLRDGSAGILENLVAIRAGAPAFDIDGPESCLQATATDSLTLAGSVFFENAASFSADIDCIDEADFALAPARGNRVVDPLLLAPFNTLSPDLRPPPTSPLVSGYVIPTADGFLDQTAAYIGAVAPANPFGSNVPWYAGWTRGY